MEKGIEMKSGMISLKSLYEWIKKHDGKGKSLSIESDLGGEYTAEVNKITKDIEKQPGFYLWGAYDNSKYWRNIYLGMATTGKKTSLKYRIHQEICYDERQFAWRIVLPGQAIIGLKKYFYPPPGWVKLSKRAIRKEGASHIIWVSVPEIETKKEIQGIEKDLIETMNPTANKGCYNPGMKYEEKSHEIISEFKKQIHKNRKNKYEIDLMPDF